MAIKEFREPAEEAAEEGAMGQAAIDDRSREAVAVIIDGGKAEVTASACAQICEERGGGGARRASWRWWQMGHGKSVSVCVDGGGRYASQWAHGVGLLSARQCADGWGGRRAESR